MAITLTQLRAFLAVNRTGGVHEAARHLYVSQPSVSAALAALERELGVELFERRGRRVGLTPAGEAFAPYAGEVIGLLEQGRQAALEAERPRLARIRVVAVNTAGEYLMPPLLQAYRRVEPEAEVLLEIVNRRGMLERVESRQADIGVGGRPLGRNTIGQPFLANELIVVARESVDDLSEATWLLREDGSGTRAATEAFLEEEGIAPAETLTLGSNGAVKQALAIGLGVTLLSRYAVARELASGQLVVVAAPGTPIVRPWFTHVPRGVAPRPAVRRFLAFLHSPAAPEAIEKALSV